MLKNDRLLKTIKKEPVDATPIWIMRQAGRYLPEYRALRERAGNFMTLCKTPELACEATLQPLARYDLDAAIIFSDILTIPDACDLGLNMVESRGPVFEKPLRSAQAIEKLTPPDPEKLRYVYDAIRLVNQELDGRLPLIGFCGSPWTLAAYMIEGESKPGFPSILKLRNEEPFLLHKLLDVLAESVANHLRCQIEAGASVVMVFDTWGGLLDRENYLEFSSYYMKQVINALRNYTNIMVPIILFTKGGSRWLDIMAETGCDCIGLDWEIDMASARARVGDKVALQGNMHPGQLLTDPETIQNEVKDILLSYGKGSGHIFNLGHGITPDVPPEHVKILVDAVHEVSKAFHTA